MQKMVRIRQKNAYFVTNSPSFFSEKVSWGLSALRAPMVGLYIYIHYYFYDFIYTYMYICTYTVFPTLTPGVMFSGVRTRTSSGCSHQGTSSEGSLQRQSTLRPRISLAGPPDAC